MIITIQARQGQRKTQLAEQWAGNGNYQYISKRHNLSFLPQIISDFPTVEFFIIRDIESEKGMARIKQRVQKALDEIDNDSSARPVKFILITDILPCQQ